MLNCGGCSFAASPHEEFRGRVDLCFRYRLWAPDPCWRSDECSLGLGLIVPVVTVVFVVFCQRLVQGVTHFRTLTHRIQMLLPGPWGFRGSPAAWGNISLLRLGLHGTEPE